MPLAATDFTYEQGGMVCPPPPPRLEAQRVVATKARSGFGFYIPWRLGGWEIQPVQPPRAPRGASQGAALVQVGAADWPPGFIPFVPPIPPIPPHPPPPIVIPQTGNFPPAGPTTMTATIPAYLYQQYADDQDLPAFFNAYNTLTQIYVGWFATAELPVYTQAQIQGGLLDWVAAGVYGMQRPALSSGKFRSKGEYNTFVYNGWPLNRFRILGPSHIDVTTDDIFKRIMTWNYYKGDGNRFNVRFLKRRVMRFLLGANGTAPNIDQTYAVSVTFSGSNVNIKLSAGSRKILGGAIYNRFTFNGFAFNTLRTQFVPGPTPLPFEGVLRDAINTGALQLPFQYTFTITVPQGV